MQTVLRIWKPLPCSLPPYSLFLLKKIKLFPCLQEVLCIWKPLPCSLPPFSLFWLNKSNYSHPCRRFCVFGSLCLILYLHSLCFESTNKNYCLPCRRFCVLEAFVLLSLPSFSLFWLKQSNYSLPCRRFCVFGSLCLVLYSILFVLIQQIKFFSSLQAVLCIWKPLPCSLPPFSLFWLNKSNYSHPCRRFCVFGSLCLVLYLHSLCFDSTNQILLFSAGGSVYLEAFALFSTPILFVLTQQIKLFPSLQAFLRVWKPA